MPIAKWAVPGSASSNIASTALDSLANGNTSAGIGYDNTSNRDFYANVEVLLGSYTSSAGGTLILNVFTKFPASSGTAEDLTSGGGDQYEVKITSGTSAKRAIFKLVRLYPYEMIFTITNSTGATTAGSSNSFRVQPFNEDVS